MIIWSINTKKLELGKLEFFTKKLETTRLGKNSEHISSTYDARVKEELDIELGHDKIKRRPRVQNKHLTKFGKTDDTIGRLTTKRKGSMLIMSREMPAPIGSVIAF